MKNFLKAHGIFLLILLAVLLAALPILTYPMGRDQGMYANIGRVILAGRTPFVDMWDIKPPPIYYLYALSIGLFGVTSQTIRALDLLFVPLALLGLYLLGQRFSSKSLGLLAALLFGVFYFNDGFQNLSQSDSLATIPSIWAAYFAVSAAQSSPKTRQALLFAFLSGALSGLLLWFKPQYAFVVFVFLAYLLYSRLIKKSTPVEEGLRPASSLLDKLSEILAFGVGGVLVAGGLLAYFAAIGVLQEMLIVGQGAAAYNAQGYDFSAFLANMSNGFYYRWIVWHGLIILNVLCLLWTFARLLFGKQEERVSSYEIFLLFWLLAGLAFAFVQAKGFDTHWFPMLPPMALLGAYILLNLLNFLSRQRQPLFIVFFTLSVIVLLIVPINTTWRGAWPYLSQQEDLVAYWDTFQANDLKPEQSLLVANFLRERVAPGDSLYIWGFRPEVYYLAGLWPATRYQAQFPLVAPWYPEAWKQNNVDILWAAMPPYVLVLQDDYMAWVTNSEADSHTLLQSYTELNNWLIANYERETQIGDFLIWKRKPR